jgi:hypothetical protein
VARLRLFGLPGPVENAEPLGQVPLPEAPEGIKPRSFDPAQQVLVVDGPDLILRVDQADARGKAVERLQEGVRLGVLEEVAPVRQVDVPVQGRRFQAQRLEQDDGRGAQLMVLVVVKVAPLRVVAAANVLDEHPGVGQFFRRNLRAVGNGQLRGAAGLCPHLAYPQQERLGVKVGVGVADAAHSTGHKGSNHGIHLRRLLRLSRLENPAWGFFNCRGCADSTDVDTH